MGRELIHTKTLCGLQQYYLNELCGKCFVYTFANGRQIEIRFRIEHFCHLLGIQRVFDYDKHYLGRAGWDKIAQGKLTLASLEHHNKAKYGQIKTRIQSFTELERLLQDGTIVNFNRYVCRHTVKIEADFVLYTEDGTKIVHLFVRQQKEEANLYAPVSFVIKSVNDRNARLYLEGQTPVRLCSRTVIEQPKNE